MSESASVRKDISSPESTPPSSPAEYVVLSPFSSPLTDPEDFISCASGTSLHDLSLYSFSEHRVVPISPSNFMRRHCRPFVPYAPVLSCICALLIYHRPPPPGTLHIQPGRIRYPLYELQSRLDSRWEAVEHPEGVLYFVWRERRIYVDTSMGHPEAAHYIYLAIAVIDDFIATHKITWPEGNVDLVLDLYPDQYRYADGVCGHVSGECGYANDPCKSMDKFFPGACGYYFVHHETRTVFWFDSLPASAIPQCGWVPVQTAAHLRHGIESQYWSHCAFFPDCRPCDKALLHELHGTIAHIYGDRIVYTRSIAGPWGREQLDHLMTLMGTLSEYGGANLGCARIVFELMAEHAVQRLVLNHGQPNVRFQADKSQYSPEELPSSWTFRIARALLFYVPDVYIRDLDDLGRDSPLQNHEWMAFMEKAMTEWQEITLYNTVLLNANIALLTIQTVDTDGEIVHSVLQMLSYASVIASICGLIVGTLLLRRHRTRAVADDVEALSYLADQYDEETGYGLLAIFYSLPFACLMYSTIAFLSAFLFMGFQRCNAGQIGGLTTLVFVALSTIVWFIWRTWRDPRRRSNVTVVGKVFFVLRKAFFPLKKALVGLKTVMSFLFTVASFVGRVLSQVTGLFKRQNKPPVEQHPMQRVHVEDDGQDV
ncbi:hypothetical protein K523DRAFT_294540 [Schizophyllum commune Tattone D]|nr:hypothetical protein K523DRAFT_294540 [Schizophyllum commune Tattone D]